MSHPAPAPLPDRSDADAAAPAPAAPREPDVMTARAMGDAASDGGQAGRARAAAAASGHAPVKPVEAASLARKLAFWGGGGVVFTAAAVAALAPQAVGAAGLILLLGLAGAGALLLYASASGLPFPLSLRPTPAPGVSPRMQDAAGAFDALPDPALILDPDGAPRLANAAFRRLSQEAGVMGESARPAGFDRVLGAHPAIAAAVFRLARAARRGEARRETLPTAPFGLERRPRRFTLEVAPIPGGRSLWRAQEAAGGADETGEGVASDTLLDEAPIGFFSADAEGRIVYLNATLRAWVGPTADRPDLRLGHFVAGDPLRAIGKPRPTARDAAPVRAEITLRGRDGISTPALVVTSWPVLTDGEGAVCSRSVVYARAGGAAPAGVAQAMAATSSIAPAGAMEAMFANAPFGVARLDRDAPGEAGISDANPALLHMTDGAAAPGARFADLFAIEAEDNQARFERGEADMAAPIEVTLAGERKRPAYAHVYFAPDSLGRLTAYVVDVTRQKELEGQLFHSQKMQAIGTLAGSVAHEMRNMLQAIVGSTYELMRRHPLGDPSYPFLVELDQHVARGKALLRQLLAFARQETVKPEVIDVPAFISDTSVWLRSMVGEKIRVETVLGRDTPHVKMGRAQLESVLMNLASNARDAMKTRASGRLEIRTRAADHEELAHEVRMDEVAEGRYAVIDVTDTGCGMDEATLEQVFDPFFTTKDQGQGTGLGLATVFGVVRQAGGHILVTSKEDVGTSFHIYLPACSAEDVAAAERDVERSAAVAAAAAAEEETTDLSGVGRILLIEDNDAVRAFTARMLEAQGYEVLQAEDGREALDIAKEYSRELDLVVSDVMMPEMDGPAFLKAAREDLGDAPVIFISGYAESEFSDLLGEETDVHFLAKPFKLDQLARRVKTLLTMQAKGG